MSLKLRDTRVYEPWIRARLGNHNTGFYISDSASMRERSSLALQGYLAHKKLPLRPKPRMQDDHAQCLSKERSRLEAESEM